MLADAPVGYWRLGEASGTVASDSSGAARHGTLGGDVTLGVAGALAADASTAYRFGGVSSVVTVADAPALAFAGTAAFAVEAWVRLDAAPTTYARLVAHEATGQGWALQFNTGDAGVRLVRSDGAGSDYLGWGADATLALGTWHHVVATYDGATMALYVDGALKQTVGSTRAVVAAATPLTLGKASHYPGQYLAGDLDEVAVYATALSAARVQAHYVAGVTG